MTGRIEEAKRLLRSEGYVVVSRERVRTLRVASILSDLSLDLLRTADRDGYLLHVKRTMFRSMGDELSKVLPVTTSPDAHGERHEINADIILPKTGD